MPIGCKLRLHIDKIKLILKPALSTPAPQPSPAQLDAVMAKLDGLAKEVKAVRDHQIKREDKLLGRLLARLEDACRPKE